MSGHYRLFSDSDHHTKPGILRAVQELGSKPAHILETGSSAWGSDSTRLWSKYVQVFGGTVWSVDLREQPRQKLGDLGPDTHLFVEDSLAFLERFGAESRHQTVDLAYLDSFDCDWTNPEPAAIHGYKEWELLQPHLRPGSIVVIDDTPRTPSDIPWLEGVKREAVHTFFKEHSVPPGKGSKVFEAVSQSRDWTILHHSYNLVVQKG